eukprot:TRINITY_DN103644_c0_g1_i1.p1 TRINITY_DN103644_c0_g1~~TRINITY_DN103644_c0_g1_i1.p1  ORF type:complete len:342 (+),score=50.14 TRINITY_DN103644_c0_g1_i1:170-1195(+)
MLAQLRTTLFFACSFRLLAASTCDAHKIEHLDSALTAEIQAKFSSRFSKLPPPEFEARLASILQRGKANPVHAEVVGFGYNLGGGFGSRTNIFMNELALAMYFNRSFVACDRGFMKSVFAAYYAIRFPMDEGHNDQCGARPPDVQRGFAPNLMKVDFDYITSLKRFLHESTMTLKPEILAQVDARLAKAGFNHEKVRYLGVHIRHADKGHEMKNGKLLPTQAYADAIKPLLLEYDLKKIFVASDDPGAGDDMKENLRGMGVTVYQEYAKTSTDREYANNESMMPLVVDIEALKRSTVFVGTHTSNMGSMIFFKRPATAVSVSLDGDWDEDCQPNFNTVCCC